MSQALARLIVRLRWVFIVGWVAVAAALTVLLPSIQEAQVGALGDLVPDDAQAIEAEQRSAELFRFPLLSRVIVVHRDPQGLSTAEQARVVSKAVAVNRGRDRFRTIVGAVPVTNLIGDAPFARERSTTALTYLFFRPDIGQRDRARIAQLYAEDLAGVVDGEGTVGVTGAIPARAAQGEIVSDKLPLVELATLIVVVLAVGLHYRALPAPLVNVAAVAIAYLCSIRLVAKIGQSIGVSVPSEVEPVIVVLLFGVVTDYTIFFLSRVRRLLDEGVERREAAVRTTADLLPIVLAAGMTIVLASASLIVAQLGFLQAFGPGMAIAVLVGVLVAVTFVPSMLAVLGSALFWPRASRAAAPAAGDPEGAAAEDLPADRPRRTRAVGLAVRHPWFVALGCTVLLAGAGSGLLFMDLGHPLVRGLPEDAGPAEAFQAAKQGFAPGVLSPQVIVVEGENVAGRREELGALQEVLEAQPGIAEVVGPGDQPLREPLGAVLSPTGDAARYVLIPGTDPLSATAVRRAENLRERLPDLLDAVGLPNARASVAGDTALVAETIAETREDVARVAPLVLAAVFGVTALLLRALVAPLYLLAASVLALVASLGLAVYLFQMAFGFDEISYFVPVTTGVLLVALGSDYNVFLVGRIWMETRRRPYREAIAVGASRAATPITVAGIVLAASFAMTALVPLQAFREIAFIMATGLLIDAFVVRTLLVPALLAIVGPASLWPGGRRRRAAERAAVETAAAPR